jgi:hypothetical protein
MSFHNSAQMLLWGDEEPAFSSYIHKDINPLSGTTKYRRIYVPNKQMRHIQAQIVRRIRPATIKLPYATAGLPGSSSKHNVERHRFNRFFVVFDLEDAYARVSSSPLDELLAQLQVSDATREMVRLYCIRPEGGLYTGGLASTDLFNLYAGHLIDRPLGEVLDAWEDVTYTRYLDDFVFSSAEPIGRRRRRHILSIIRDAGFTHNRGKAQVVDLREAKLITINGLRLEYGGRIFVPRRFVNSLYALLKRANGGDPVDHNIIAGQMGAFWSATSRYESQRNGIERSIVREYRLYKEGWRKSHPASRHKVEGRRRRQRNRRRQVGVGPNWYRKTSLAAQDRAHRRFH